MGLLNRLKSNSLGARVRRDRISDLRELLEVEQRQWGPRMRYVASSGEPMAGLGFTGIVVPNNELTVNPAAVTASVETCLYTLASTGTSTWMYIPPGNFRAPQSWRVWAGGTYTTTATTQTITWTTRVGSATGATSNASFGVTGAMAPGSVGTGSPAAGALWWYEAHMSVRTPGTVGSVMGVYNVSMANSGSFTAPTNVATSIGGTGINSIALDVTQGNFWCIDTNTSTSSVNVQLTQFMIVAWD